MRDTLRAGLRHSFTYRVPETKLVSALFPEASEFQAMPRVFATGFMVGFIEWACIQAVHAHLDWPREQSVGTHVNISHLGAAPPGLEVVGRVRVIEVDGRRLVFEIEASDGVDVISRGTHERFIIDAERFIQKVRQKAATDGV